MDKLREALANSLYKYRAITLQVKEIDSILKTIEDAGFKLIEKRQLKAWSNKAGSIQYMGYIPYAAEELSDEIKKLVGE